MYAALKQLDSLGPFLLVDWAREHLVPLSEEVGMLHVLREYTEFLKTLESEPRNEAPPSEVDPSAKSRQPWWRFWR